MPISHGAIFLHDMTRQDIESCCAPKNVAIVCSTALDII